MKVDLVKTITDDGIILSGLLVESSEDKPALIYIHGFEGDFYSHKFISTIGERLEKDGMTFLTVQTRGTAVKQELVTSDGGWLTGGALYEKLEEAYQDIDAWVEFLKSLGNKRIMLAGHSLGTYKVMKYLTEGRHAPAIEKVVLLCPFDKNWLLKQAAQEVGKTLEEQIEAGEKKVHEGQGQEIAPYGFDDVPHSYENFLSWAKQDEAGRMFDFHLGEPLPYLNQIQIPVHIIVGSKDEFLHPSNPEKPEEAVGMILQRLTKGSSLILPGAKHAFRGFEDELAEEILTFLN